MDNTWAAPGVRCVCIFDDWNWVYSFGPYSLPTRCPMIGEVLTIKSVETYDSSDGSKVGLVFHEIEMNQSDGPISANICWGAHCFRPLIERKTDISIFTSMLTGDKVSA